MTKSDLKNGMVVRVNNRERQYWLVLNNFLMDFKGGMRLDRFNHNLTSNDENICADVIEEVYVLNENAVYLKDVIDPNYLISIWKRESRKEMTIQQIEDALGYSIKIVK